MASAARPGRPASAAPRPAAAPRATGTPRDAQRHLDVLERGELRQQVVELEDEADVAVAERDQRASSVTSRHVDVADARSSPASGRSSPPSTCSSVLFPTPDAPTMATISPRAHLEVEVAQHVQPLPGRPGTTCAGPRRATSGTAHSWPQRLGRDRAAPPGATGRSSREADEQRRDHHQREVARHDRERQVARSGRRRRECGSAR